MLNRASLRPFACCCICRSLSAGEHHGCDDLLLNAVSNLTVLPNPVRLDQTVAGLAPKSLFGIVNI